MNNHRLRVVIIISPDIQDKYLASHLLDHFNVVGIFVEPQYRAGNRGDKIKQNVQRLIKYKFNPVTIIKAFFDKRYYHQYIQRARELFHENFYEKGRMVDNDKGCPVYDIKTRDMCSPENEELLTALRPDILVLCGCSILKNNILKIPKNGSINLHSGLAPYYRGCSCYFWSLYNNEPEYLGVTVHYVSPGIDDGDIIHQGRPEFEETDNELTLFVKMMKMGSELMVQTIKEIESGTVKSYTQTEKGKVYLDHETTVKHFRILHKRLKRGLITEYLSRLRNNKIVPPVIIE